MALNPALRPGCDARIYRVVASQRIEGYVRADDAEQAMARAQAGFWYEEPARGLLERVFVIGDIVEEER